MGFYAAALVYLNPSSVSLASLLILLTRMTNELEVCSCTSSSVVTVQLSNKTLLRYPDNSSVATVIKFTKYIPTFDAKVARASDHGLIRRLVHNSIHKLAPKLDHKLRILNQ